MEFVTGALGFVVFILAALIAIAGLFLPLVVWQMNNRIGRLETRAFEMHQTLAVMEDHLRAMRSVQTGERL